MAQPSREYENELDNEMGQRGSKVEGGETMASPRLQTRRKNFHITHLCAIFKLTIVNFFSFCFAVFFSFMRRRNKTRESKKKENEDLTVCLLKEHFFRFFFLGFLYSGNVEIIDNGYIEMQCIEEAYPFLYFRCYS